MKKQGLLLILSGPSGSGKGTIVEQLKAKDDFALSISATTRAPREYEQDGVHYFFRTREEFERMIANQELLEWAEFCGQLLWHTESICNRTAAKRPERDSGN